MCLTGQECLFCASWDTGYLICTPHGFRYLFCASWHTRYLMCASHGSGCLFCAQQGRGVYSVPPGTQVIEYVPHMAVGVHSVLNRAVISIV